MKYYKTESHEDELKDSASHFQVLTFLSGNSVRCEKTGIALKMFKRNRKATGFLKVMILLSNRALHDIGGRTLSIIIFILHYA